MHENEKKARSYIGQNIGGRTILDVIYKSRIGKDKVRSDWYYLCRCSKGHQSCLRMADLTKSECVKCYIPHNKKQDGVKKRPSYAIWTMMKQRCNNPKNKDYKHYGARGIKVCPRWNLYLNFYEDMGEKPEGLTLDRIDNNGNYELSNCRWVTQKEQILNSRKCLK